jgi:uncharacterized protein YbjT (DUF2867 family)
MSVFVIGATGNIGRRVVRSLVDRGTPVTALVRETEPGELPADSPLALPGVTVVRGDLREPTVLAAQAQGCQAVFVLTPHAPNQVELQNAAVDVAADIGAGIVKVSSWGPAVREDSPVPGARRHWITQQYIFKRGVPYTILCPNYFMQVLINRYAAEVRRSARLVSPAGNRGISMVDAADVADVAAEALSTGSHWGRIYTLSGGRAVTYPEIARLLSELTGRPVGYHDLSGSEFAEWMAGENRQQWETDHAAAIFGLYRQGVGELVTDDVRNVLGREPRTIEDFLKANIQHFQPEASGS